MFAHDNEDMSHLPDTAPEPGQNADHPYTALTPDCVIDALCSAGLAPDGQAEVKRSATAPVARSIEKSREGRLAR